MTARTTTFPLKGAVRIEWASLAKDVIGDRATVLGFRDKTVGVGGTFDEVTVSIEGSMDGLTWVTLKNPLGDPLTFSSDGLEAILENPIFIRPVITDAGEGTTNVFVIIAGNA